jgi:hypothetical protein
LALYPHYIYLSALFEYPQPLFILLMGLAFLLLYRFQRTAHTGALVVAGLCVGLAILTVPTVLLFVPLLVLSLLAIRTPRFLRSAAILLLTIALPVGIWAYRNYVAYHHVVLVNEAGGANFWAANNETYFAYGKDAVTPCRTQNANQIYCREKAALYARLQAAHLSEQQAILAEEAASWAAGWDFVRAAPGREALLAARKVLELWSPTPDVSTHGTYNGGEPQKWISILSYTPLLLLALYGAFLLRHELWRLLPIYAYAATFTAVYAVFLPTTRYRLPLDFFLVVLAAFVIAQRCEARQTQVAAALVPPLHVT